MRRRAARTMVGALLACAPCTPCALAQAPATTAAEAPATAPAPVAFADTRTELEGLTVVARVAPREGAPSSTPFEVGSPIVIELRFEGDARTTASLDAAKTLGDFDVVSVRGPVAAKDGATIAEIVVMTLESGALAPAPIGVRWAVGGAVKTAEVALPAVEVASLLGKEIDPAKFRDIAGELALSEAPKPRNMVLAAIALVAAAVVAALVAWRLLRARKAIESADAWALAALAALEREGLPARGEFARYYDRLVEIVRGYVARRFAMFAERQTSREFLAAATAHAEFPEGERERLRGLLRLADLVKFAAATPERSECDAHLADARAFVAATKPRDRDDADRDITRPAAQEVAR